MNTTGQLSSDKPRQQISVKKRVDLASYFGMVYTLKAYYDAMKQGAELPKKKLPPLQDLIDAHTIVLAYIEAKQANVHINLIKAMLGIEELVAVWLFYNAPNYNIQLGHYQLVTLQHN